MRSSGRPSAEVVGDNICSRRIGLRSGASVSTDRRERSRTQAIPGIRLTRILVPVDFSRASAKSLCYASALAKLHGAKIILLHITKPLLSSGDFGYGPVNREVA